MDAPGIDDDEFTRLSEFHPDRVDLVKNAANGTRFLIAKQDAGAGLLDPDFVRGLIAKTAPEETPVPESAEAWAVPLANGIVLKGSPADIAAFFHAASAPPVPTPADVAKAKNDTADREKKAASGAAMSDGSYPIASEEDLKKAIHAVGRGSSGHDSIRKHIISRARSLGASSEIPDNWNSDGSLKGDVSKEADVPGAVAKADPMGAAGDATVLDAGIDGLDPTVPLAAPDAALDLPGDPTDPGSPAWEGIDAASAQKWLSIAARLKNALGVLAEREMLEAASADPSDIENAWNLEDAMCAVDFAIEQLAVFAAGEQAEAELGAECEEMCKALAAVDPAPLLVIEGLGPASVVVRKAGRVLSSANEAAIRAAADSLQKVLASLPEAPIAKEKEGTVPDKDKAADVAKERSPEEQARDSGPVSAGGTTGLGAVRGTGPSESLPADGPQAALPGDAPGRTVIKAAAALRVLVYDRANRECRVRADAIRDPAPVAKADGDAEGKTPMQAVFDEDGSLIGIVDPADITPVSGTGGSKSEPEAPAADPGDMTPQPPADAGVPADAVGKSADPPAPAAPAVDLESVLKALADSQTSAAARQAEALELVAKSVAAGNAELAEQVATLKARLVTVENTPAAPGVFSNGQVPPEGARPVPPAAQLRGQDAGAPPVSIAKAAELKQELYTGSPARQVQVAGELTRAAVAKLTEIHAAAAR